MFVQLCVGHLVARTFFVYSWFGHDDLIIDFISVIYASVILMHVVSIFLFLTMGSSLDVACNVVL